MHPAVFKPLGGGAHIWGGTWWTGSMRKITRSDLTGTP
jgi:hypothetical protein